MITICSIGTVLLWIYVCFLVQEKLFRKYPKISWAIVIATFCLAVIVVEELNY